MIYPANINRDNFYNYSQVLVDRADNIRLEDISLSYEIDRATWQRLPFNRVRLFFYVSNIGALWIANKDGIDPYYNNVPKNGKRAALGLNLDF